MHEKQSKTGQNALALIAANNLLPGAPHLEHGLHDADVASEGCRVQRRRAWRDIIGHTTALIDRPHLRRHAARLMAAGRAP